MGTAGLALAVVTAATAAVAAAAAAAALVEEPGLMGAASASAEVPASRLRVVSASLGVILRVSAAADPELPGAAAAEMALFEDVLPTTRLIAAIAVAAVAEPLPREPLAVTPLLSRVGPPPRPRPVPLPLLLPVRGLDGGYAVSSGDEIAAREFATMDPCSAGSAAVDAESEDVVPLALVAEARFGPWHRGVDGAPTLPPNEGMEEVGLHVRDPFCGR